MAKQYGLIHMKKSEDARTKREVKVVIDKALEEDPNIFAYDEVYDDMKKEQNQRAGVSTASGDGAKRQSKFIGGLKQNAEMRKIAEERRIDRKIEREREAEGDQFADKEIFVTEAYKQKLLERKLYDEREKKEIELEEMMDAKKHEVGLTAFYRNVLSQRVGEKIEMKPKERFLDKVTEDLKRQLLSKDEDGEKSKSVEFKKSNKATQHSKRQRRSSSSSEEDVVVSDLRKNKERKRTNHEREHKKERRRDDEGEQVAKSTEGRAEKVDDDLKENDKEPKDKQSEKTEESEGPRPSDNDKPAADKPAGPEKPAEPEQPRLSLREILTELFTKRCVGEEFTEQQRRYFERRANRQS